MRRGVEVVLDALLIDHQWSWRENQALTWRVKAALAGRCLRSDINYRAERGLNKRCRSVR